MEKSRGDWLTLKLKLNWLTLKGIDMRTGKPEAGSLRTDSIPYLWFYFSELLPLGCTSPTSIFPSHHLAVAAGLLSTHDLTQRTKRVGCFWMLC